MTDRSAIQGAPASSSRLTEPSTNAQLEAIREIIRKAVAARVDWIQIREKDLAGRTLAELVRVAVADARGTGTRILVNGRLDVALAAGAHGIHFGETSLPVDAVTDWRRSSGKSEFHIGCSCHSLETARAAERAGADYIFFGPVFLTPSKAAYGPPQGIGILREVCSSVSIPVLAIGGVTLENAPSCMVAGAAGIAAIRLFQDKGNVAERITQLRKVVSTCS